MAIDTRAKRQNVAQIGCPLPVSILPAGTIDGAARSQIAWTYRGITINPPVFTVAASPRRIFTVPDGGQSREVPGSGRVFIVPDGGQNKSA